MGDLIVVGAFSVCCLSITAFVCLFDVYWVIYRLLHILCLRVLGLGLGTLHDNVDPPSS
jgi:hypothetical protein